MATKLLLYGYIHIQSPQQRLLLGPKTTGLDPDDQEGSDSETLSETEQAVEEVPRTKLVTLCWICVPLYDTGRVVNMDNYYTSPSGVH
jgi:hypothetical protein